MTHYIDGKWIEGKGKPFTSLSPATQEIVWEGKEATADQVDEAFRAAKEAQLTWRKQPMEERISYLMKLQDLIKDSRIAEVITRDNGKNQEEAEGEVASMMRKIPLSIEAYKERCKPRPQQTPRGTLQTQHKPHGVIGVLGPFNFPGHTPFGHIIPALLVGNTIVFKGSEFTPLVSEKLFQCFEKAGFPPGVVNMVQGGSETGKLVASHPFLDGLFFTGSAHVGGLLAQQFAKTPGKILALEMGGNNPLIVESYDDLDKAVDLVIESAYITTGQRCSCARRVILVESEKTKGFIEALKKKVAALDLPPLIHLESMEELLAAQKKMIQEGGIPLVEMKQTRKNLPFVSPGLVDVTPLKMREDRENFGPLLQLIRVKTLDEAITEANRTHYGLTAGLLSQSEEKFDLFFDATKAGVINWNAPLTGTSGVAPFGGVGMSGNFRPAAFYMVDDTVYPVATLRGLP